VNYEWGPAAEAGKWQRAVPVWFMTVILLALAASASGDGAENKKETVQKETVQ
jgi:hypothetical protein